MHENAPDVHNTSDDVELGIAIIDQLGTIAQANTAFCRLFGYPSNDLVGVPIERLLPSELDVGGPGADDQPPMPAGARKGFRADGSLMAAQVRAVPLGAVSSGGTAVVVLGTPPPDGQQPAQPASKAARPSREALGTLNTFFANAPVGFALVDETLRYRWVNNSLARYNGIPISEHVGRTIYEIMPDLAAVLEPAFQHVLTTGTPYLQMHVNELASIGERKGGYWVSDYYPVQMIDGSLGVGVVVSDITHRKRSDQLHALQFNITRILAEAETRYAAIPQLLQTMSANDGWSLGELWRMDDDAAVLRLESDWHTPTLDISQFTTLSRTATFPKGLGLIGRTWQYGEPQWQEYIADDTVSLRSIAAAQAGLRSAFAFPIRSNGAITGVMAFWSTETRIPEPNMLEFSRNIGSQIGQFFDRKQAEERLWEYAQRLEVQRAIDHAILELQVPQEVARAILQHIRDLIPCRRAVIAAFDERATDRFAWVVETGGASNDVRRSYEVLTALAPIETLQRGQHVQIDDLRALLRGPSNNRPPLYDGARSLVCMPITWHDTLLGALYLIADRPRAYSADSLAIAREVADQLALALQNAHLFEQIQIGRARMQLLSSKLVQTQEEERRRLARELHDEIGQALTAAHLNLQILAEPLPPPIFAERLEDSSSLLEGVLQQVRTMSLNLRPSLLDDLGLAPALRWLLHRQAERVGWVTHFSADELEARYPSDVETTYFRIAQEALSNAARHAQARTVSIDLAQHNGVLRMIIQDDGIGFDVQAAQARAVMGQSLGLLSMHERMELAGGTWNVRSSAGQGTQITVQISVVDNKPVVGSGKNAQ